MGVEGQMTVDVLRILPVERLATACRRARPHDTTRQVGAGKQHLELLDEDERGEHLLAELDSKAAVANAQIRRSDHVLGVGMGATCREEVADGARAQRVVHHVPVERLNVHHAAVQIKDVDAPDDVSNALCKVEHIHGAGRVHREDRHTAIWAINKKLSFHSIDYRAFQTHYLRPTFVDFTPKMTW